MGGEARRAAISPGGVSLRAFERWSLIATLVVGGGCSRESATVPDDVEPRATVSPKADVPPATPEQPAVEAVADPPPPEPLPTAEQAGACPQTDDPAVGIMISPRQPTAGQPITVVAATLQGEAPLALRVEGQDGAPLEVEVKHRPGVPSAVIARFTPDTNATVVVGRAGQGGACLTVRPKSATRRRPRPASSAGVWPVKRRWDAGEEALYSAWVREMFTAPPGEDLAWKRLDQVTSDASRNLLHDSYGWSEDNPDPAVGLRMKPDCADTPYFLRGYFAWKRELPFAYRRCSRGRGKAPACGPMHATVGPPEHDPDGGKPGELGALQKYMRRTLAWGVHSGNGRTALADDDTDFYPLALRRSALRPGVIYADPYGHLFVLVEWMNPSGGAPGILYAIDGQPDGSITRKRFWEGNFLWNPEPSLGGSGFKGFRPHRLVGKGDARSVEVPTNEELAGLPGYEDFSEEQGGIDSDGFYDRMDALITPGHRDAVAAQDEAIRALFEAAKVRVTSVENGDGHVAKGGTIDMPSGHAIFETTGAWENFSTPARDLRLLIAIDLVRGFDAKVGRNPDVYLEAGQSMEQLREQLATARTKMLADEKLAFEYTRSDGSPWSVTVADLLERSVALEVGYNPNDCPELRWGAPEGSAERKTCRRRAPALQQRKMAAYRPWFEQRRRPARGDPGPSVE